MNFNISSRKQGCQIRTWQESIGTCYIDIIFSFGIKTVDRQLKFQTHLYFVYKEIIYFPCFISFFYVCMKSMILFYFLKSQIHKINNDNIGIFKITFQILNICLHQLGFTGTANTSDNLNIGSSI